MNQRRVEILGILLVTVSSLVLISLLGYNSNEGPGISPNIKIENKANNVVTDVISVLDKVWFVELFEISIIGIDHLHRH